MSEEGVSNGEYTFEVNPYVNLDTSVGGEILSGEANHDIICESLGLLGLPVPCNDLYTLCSSKSSYSPPIFLRCLYICQMDYVNPDFPDRRRILVMFFSPDSKILDKELYFGTKLKKMKLSNLIIELEGVSSHLPLDKFRYGDVINIVPCLNLSLSINKRPFIHPYTYSKHVKSMITYYQRQFASGSYFDERVFHLHMMQALARPIECNDYNPFSEPILVSDDLNCLIYNPDVQISTTTGIQRHRSCPRQAVLSNIFGSVGTPTLGAASNVADKGTFKHNLLGICLRYCNRVMETKRSVMFNSLDKSVLIYRTDSELNTSVFSEFRLDLLRSLLLSEIVKLTGDPAMIESLTFWPGERVVQAVLDELDKAASSSQEAGELADSLTGSHLKEDSSFNTWISSSLLLEHQDLLLRSIRTWGLMPQREYLSFIDDLIQWCGRFCGLCEHSFDGIRIESVVSIEDPIFSIVWGITARVDAVIDVKIAADGVMWNDASLIQGPPRNIENDIHSFLSRLRNVPNNSIGVISPIGDTDYPHMNNIRTKFGSGKRIFRIPLEFKTGAYKEGETSHKEQASLYSLLLQEKKGLWSSEGLKSTELFAPSSSKDFFDTYFLNESSKFTSTRTVETVQSSIHGLVKSASLSGTSSIRSSLNSNGPNSPLRKENSLVYSPPRPSVSVPRISEETLSPTWTGLSNGINPYNILYKHPLPPHNGSIFIHNYERMNLIPSPVGIVRARSSSFASFDVMAGNGGVLPALLLYITTSTPHSSIEQNYRPILEMLDRFTYNSPSWVHSLSSPLRSMSRKLDIGGNSIETTRQQSADSTFVGQKRLLASSDTVWKESPKREVTVAETPMDSNIAHDSLGGRIPEITKRLVPPIRPPPFKSQAKNGPTSTNGTIGGGSSIKGSDSLSPGRISTAEVTTSPGRDRVTSTFLLSREQSLFNEAQVSSAEISSHSINFTSTYSSNSRVTFEVKKATEIFRSVNWNEQKKIADQTPVNVQIVNVVKMNLLYALHDRNSLVLSMANYKCESVKNALTYMRKMQSNGSESLSKRSEDSMNCPSPDERVDSRAKVWEKIKMRKNRFFENARSCDATSTQTSKFIPTFKDIKDSLIDIEDLKPSINPLEPPISADLSRRNYTCEFCNVRNLCIVTAYSDAHIRASCSNGSLSSVTSTSVDSTSPTSTMPKSSDRGSASGTLSFADTLLPCDFENVEFPIEKFTHSDAMFVRIWMDIALLESLESKCPGEIDRFLQAQDEVEKYSDSDDQSVLLSPHQVLRHAVNRSLCNHDHLWSSDVLKSSSKSAIFDLQVIDKSFNLATLNQISSGNPDLKDGRQLNDPGNYQPEVPPVDNNSLELNYYYKLALPPAPVETVSMSSNSVPSIYSQISALQSSSERQNSHISSGFNAFEAVTPSISQLDPISASVLSSTAPLYQDKVDLTISDYEDEEGNLEEGGNLDSAFLDATDCSFEYEPSRMSEISECMETQNPVYSTQRSNWSNRTPRQEFLSSFMNQTVYISFYVDRQSFLPSVLRGPVVACSGQVVSFGTHRSVRNNLNHASTCEVDMDYIIVRSGVNWQTAYPFLFANSNSDGRTSVIEEKAHIFFKSMVDFGTHTISSPINLNGSSSSHIDRFFIRVEKKPTSHYSLITVNLLNPIVRLYTAVSPLFSEQNLIVPRPVKIRASESLMAGKCYDLTQFSLMFGNCRIQLKDLTSLRSGSGDDDSDYEGGEDNEDSKSSSTADTFGPEDGIGESMVDLLKRVSGSVNGTDAISREGNTLESFSSAFMLKDTQYTNLIKNEAGSLLKIAYIPTSFLSRHNLDYFKELYESTNHGTVKKTLSMTEEKLVEDVFDVDGILVNKDQFSAIQLGMENIPFSIIEGFPGTGKTLTSAILIRSLMKAGNTVLLSAFTHASLNELLGRVVTLFNSHSPLGLEPTESSSSVSENSSRIEWCNEIIETGILRLMRQTDDALHIAEVLRPYTLVFDSRNRVYAFRRVPVETDSAPIGGTRAINNSRTSWKYLAELIPLPLTALVNVLFKVRLVAISAMSVDCPLLRRTAFDVLLLDEAAQCPFPYALGASLRAGRTVFVGDVLQLQPLSALAPTSAAGLSFSLMETLLNHSLTLQTVAGLTSLPSSGKCPRLCRTPVVCNSIEPAQIDDPPRFTPPVQSLTVQYRMVPSIMKLANSLIYGDRLQASSSACQRYLTSLTFYQKYLSLSSTNHGCGFKMLGLFGLGQKNGISRCDSQSEGNWVRSLLERPAGPSFVDTSCVSISEQFNGSDFDFLGSTALKCEEISLPEISKEVLIPVTMSIDKSIFRCRSYKTLDVSDSVNIEQHHGFGSGPSVNTINPLEASMTLMAALGFIMRAEQVVDLIEDTEFHQILGGKSLQTFLDMHDGIMLLSPLRSQVALMRLFLNTLIENLESYDTSVKSNHTIPIGSCHSDPNEKGVHSRRNEAHVSINISLSSSHLTLQLQQFKYRVLRRLREIGVDTVDRLQGADKAIVIFSSVRSNTNGSIGRLLSDKRRLNVLLTRPKNFLVMVGSRPTLCNHFEEGKSSNGVDFFQQLLKQIESVEYEIGSNDFSESVVMSNRSYGNINSPNPVNPFPKIVYNSAARDIANMICPMDEVVLRNEKAKFINFAIDVCRRLVVSPYEFR